MSSKTRIVVLHMKEVIYTAIFLLLGLLMIILLLIMFGPSKDKETAASVQTTSALTGQYLPGVYSTAIELSDNTCQAILSHFHKVHLFCYMVGGKHDRFCAFAVAY